MEQIDRDVVAETEEDEREEKEALRRIEKRRVKATIGWFIVGLGSFIGGIIVIGQFRSWGGLLLILLGVVIVMRVLGVPVPSRRPPAFGGKC
jgi:hypothetical protein